MSHDPLAFLRRVSLTPPSSDNKTADADRIVEEIRKSSGGDLQIPIDLLRKIPGALRQNGFKVNLIIGHTGDSVRLVDISLDRAFGLALDIGSTNMECSVFDLSSGEKVAVAEAENPQVEYGSDVLTRAQHSMMGRFDLLSGSLLGGINRLIGDLCSSQGIAGEEIVAMTVAGNTIMAHFFLGLDVNNIPLSPYVPVINRAVFLSGKEAGLGINRNAVVYVFPNAGSYVGGDIVSGIIHAGILQEDAPALFIDVGTNVEVTIGSRDWIMTGAGAAGPALEGGIASIGRKTEPGTIFRVRLDRDTGTLATEVISGVEPQGICGSGLIELIAQLFDAGVIDQTGKFTESAIGVEETDGVKSFVVYRAGGKELLLTEPEIRNFLISKAAMFSFLYVFVKSVGLTFRDIRKVYVAGALGCGIDLESAVSIGMLPDIPRERFIPLGNSSLAGAEKVLLDSGLLAEVDRAASMITYREMNEDSELMNVLQGAMFLPHTDPELLRG